jgi:L,D-transpeptidase-like protein
MRRLFVCAALSTLLLSSPVSALEVDEETVAPVSVANAPLSAETALEPAAVGNAPASRVATTPAASSLAAAVAQELSRPPPPPPITLVLKADLRAQRLTVEEKGKVRHVWLISSGRGGYSTKTGTFRPQWTSRMHYSRQYDLSPMPHAVFFNSGTAFHGTQAVGLLGRPASHGCIRLAPGNAAQLYGLVHRHGMYQTKVIVHGGSKGPAVARRNLGPAKTRVAAVRRDAEAGQRNKRSRFGQNTSARIRPY